MRCARVISGLVRAMPVMLVVAAVSACSDDPTGPGGGGGPDPDDFVQVTTGMSHSCGLRAGGDVLCWGSNDLGQLGDGEPGPDTVTTPVPVASTLEFAAIAAGAAHTCALTAEGEAHCWGSDSDGQLGHGPNSLLTGLPTPVEGDLVFVALTAGDAHTCGLTAPGAAFCWGANDFGQLGDGNVGSDSSTPVPVDGDLELVSISAGGGHTCGVTVSGAAHCWGNNGTEQLGDGTTDPSDVPVAVQGGLVVASVAAGGVHSCGLTATGSAHCWGFNFFGQLGDGTEDNRGEPTPVTGGLELDRLAAGSDHTCGLAVEGTAYCWGFNGDGRVGDGGDTSRSEPTAVDGGLVFTDIAPSHLHTCAVDDDGTVWCWGSNDSGQLGDGTTQQRLSPVPVIMP